MNDYEPGVLAFGGVELPEHLINKDVDLYFENKDFQNCSKMQLDLMIYNSLHEKKFDKYGIFMSVDEIKDLSVYECFIHLLSLRNILGIKPFRKVSL